jgi:hypothetical protein
VPAAEDDDRQGDPSEVERQRFAPSQLDVQRVCCTGDSESL